MKKRRNAIVAFLLCAVLCLAVGYAALSDTLYVDGKVKANAAENGPSDEKFEQEVYFSAANFVDFTAKNEATKVEIATDKDSHTKDLVKINIESDDIVYGTPVVVEATILNESQDDSLTAEIALPTETNYGNTNTEYFKVSVKWKENQAVVDTTTNTASLKQNDYVEALITIELIKTPTSDEGVEATFSFTFEATGK